ncbi:HDOD domain-containing protein [Pseudomonas sp. sp1636]|uniref:HDOD domain-containing protein n=1 Tax=Pseudomonas sp. sp1636 TaxID=3036707 RepID=UPI0025A5A9CE|nr:HDOD domain-containing protein [Pseudomonas sp. sp1636]MDM8349013.1 HDOD domain-containing protein [Pseudomonas sp. sp1636]
MRVMILEDDHWIADLLKQIVLSLRPGAEVICLGSVAEALADWQQRVSDLVISDWNLPDGEGTRLLKRVRQQNRQLPLVMVSARSDRSSVVEVRALGINAFISKPFQASRVAASLDKLLPALGAQDSAVALASDEDLVAYLEKLPAGELDLPLSQGIRDRLRQHFKDEQLSLRELAEDWRHDPALNARLLTVANSSAYNGAGRPCISLLEALQKLGAATSLNLAMGLALRQASALDNPLLRRLADAHLDASEQLAEKSMTLARQCELDPAPFHCAALLHRMGELCVLYLAQAWATRGHRLGEAQVAQALGQFSSPFAIAIKARWQLPMALRELIGACYALPNNSVKRASVLMRLAACELDASGDSNDQARLRRLAGLA